MAYPYITQTQVERRAAGVRWWTDDSAAGTTSATIVTEAIQAAEGEIDAAAMQQYAVPLALSDASTERVIRNVAGSIAVYKLASRVPPVPDDIERAYTAAMTWLKDLAAGKFGLPGETAVDPGRPTGAPVIAGDPIILTRDEMDGL